MTLSTTLRTALATATVTVIAACTASYEPHAGAAEPSSTGTEELTAAGATTTVPDPAWSVEFGDFPEFPQGRLPESVAAELQALLDAAVEEETIQGASAAVVVAGSGRWSGGAGVNPVEGGPMTAASVLPTGSVGKTVIAAQVLRLVDEGKLGLDDRAADHYPPSSRARRTCWTARCSRSPRRPTCTTSPSGNCWGCAAGLPMGSCPPPPTQGRRPCTPTSTTTSWLRSSTTSRAVGSRRQSVRASSVAPASTASCSRPMACGGPMTGT